MKSVRVRFAAVGVLTSLCLIAATSGCGPGTTITIEVDGNEPTGPITVVLVNETDVAVDPHLYVSDSTLSADELFADEHNLYANFDGAAIIAAESSVSVEFECDELGTIGSNEASFGSWTDWDSAGKSQESPVIQIGVTENAPTCEQILIIRFYRDDDDNYHTKWRAASADELQ